MLRTLQALLLSSCLVSAASAVPVRCGLKAGSSIPNLRDNGGNEFSSGWSTRVGLFLGTSAEVSLTPRLSVQAELNYSQQGAKKNGLQAVSLPDVPMTLFADIKNTAKLDYLEIPVLAKYRIGGARQFYATFGPYVGFLLTAKNVSSGSSLVYLDQQKTQPVTGSPVDFGATTDIKSELRSTNWGIQGGVGYQRPIGSGRIELDVRGGYGLVNVQKDTAVNGKNNTGSLVVSLGYGVLPH